MVVALQAHVGGGVEVEEHELRRERRRRHQAQDAIGQGQVPAAITKLPLHDRSSLTETMPGRCNHRSSTQITVTVLPKVRIEVQLPAKFLLYKTNSDSLVLALKLSL